MLRPSQRQWTALRWPALALLIAGVLVALYAGGTGNPGTASARGGEAQPASAAVEATASPAEDAAETSGHASAASWRLEDDERLGGHTLARHVGVDEAGLRARLRRERRIGAASSYRDRKTAERVVNATLSRERARVDRWVSRRGSRPNLALDYDGSPGEVIGYTLRRGARRLAPCHDAVVVLRWDNPIGRWYVLTSYPEDRE